jgi:pimeloyl-ACP methyl ester carboxylesterase
MLPMVTLLAALFFLPLAPGKLIDAGGYRVHLYCTGEGNPTVMIVGAGFSTDWGLVQPEIAKFTRVCTYDPRGMAWSDPAPAAETGCSGRVAEIHAVLKNAGISGPRVLVGLSVGALVARLYAQRYPEEVTGMVIVDHAFLDPVDQPSHIQSTPGLDSPPVLISQTPIEYTMEEISDFNHLPLRNRLLHRWAMSLHPNMPSVEMARACVEEIAGKTLGDLPLTVVSTGNTSPNYAKLQSQLMSLSRNSKQLMAEKSFHAVQIDQPEIVVEAIRQMVEAVRK